MHKTVQCRHILYQKKHDPKCIDNELEKIRLHRAKICLQQMDEISSKLLSDLKYTNSTQDQNNQVIEKYENAPDVSALTKNCVFNKLQKSIKLSKDINLYNSKHHNKHYSQHNHSQNYLFQKQKTPENSIQQQDKQYNKIIDTLGAYDFKSYMKLGRQQIDNLQHKLQKMKKEKQQQKQLQQEKQRKSHTISRTTLTQNNLNLKLKIDIQKKQEKNNIFYSQQQSQQNQKEEEQEQDEEENNFQTTFNRLCRTYSQAFQFKQNLKQQIRLKSTTTTNNPTNNPALQKQMNQSQKPQQQQYQQQQQQLQNINPRLFRKSKSMDISSTFFPSSPIKNILNDDSTQYSFNFLQSNQSDKYNKKYLSLNISQDSDKIINDSIIQEDDQSLQLLSDPDRKPLKTNENELLTQKLNEYILSTVKTDDSQLNEFQKTLQYQIQKGIITQKKRFNTKTQNLYLPNPPAHENPYQLTEQRINQGLQSQKNQQYQKNYLNHKRKQSNQYQQLDLKNIENSRKQILKHVFNSSKTDEQYANLEPHQQQRKQFMNNEIIDQALQKRKQILQSRSHIKNAYTNSLSLPKPQKKHYQYNIQNDLSKFSTFSLINFKKHKSLHQSPSPKSYNNNNNKNVNNVNS